MTGRTIVGKNAPRGQEMCDHYFAPLNQVHLAQLSVVFVELVPTQRISLILNLRCTERASEFEPEIACSGGGSAVARRKRARAGVHQGDPGGSLHDGHPAPHAPSRGQSTCLLDGRGGRMG
eukprot:3879562-Rhodomonas_salina.1